MKLLAVLMTVACMSFGVSIPGSAENINQLSSAQRNVKSLVETAYLNGAFNRLDTKAMREGFHTEFAILGVYDGKLFKYPIVDWVNRIEQMKAQADFNPEDHKAEYRLSNIDITGSAASVKVELFQQGKQTYTDYLSLIKFKSGWKIVAKIYNKHGE